MDSECAWRAPLTRRWLRHPTASYPHSAPAADHLPQCGSCWAFSELAAIESKVLLTTQTTAADNPIDLAEQQVRPVLPS